MKNNLIWALPLLISIALLSFSCKKNEYSINVYPTKDTFMEGEDINLNIKIINLTNDSIEVPAIAAFRGCFKFDLRNSKGEAIMCKELYTDVIDWRMKIAQKETKNITLNLLQSFRIEYKNCIWGILPKDTYTFKLEYHPRYKHDLVPFNKTISFNIVKPDSSELEPYNLYIEAQNNYWTWVNPDKDKALNIFNEIIQKYPNSYFSQKAVEGKQWILQHK
ncbi:MAG: hypothetical protein Q7U71_02800 [bacterium]|nr:hypothetical protein [bacterium]